MADPIQAAVDTAGLGSIDADLAGLRKYRGDLGERAGKISEQELASGQRTQELVEKKMGETAPAREAVAKRIKEAPAGTVKEEPIPKYERPQMDPEDLKKTFGMLMVASMLVGAASRNPYNNVMTAMTGALNGFQAGDRQRVEESLKIYDKNVAQIKATNEQKRREVDDAWKKYKNDVLGLQTELELIAQKYDDPLTLEAARSKSLSVMQKTIDSNIRSTDQTIDRLERMKMQFQQHKEDRDQRAAIAKMHHEDAVKAREDKKGGDVPQDMIDFYAKMAVAGDWSWRTGLGRGARGSNIIAAVDARVPSLAAEMGLTPADVGTNKAKIASLGNAIRDRQKAAAAAEQFVNNFKSQTELVDKYLKPGVGGATPVFNKWIQAGRRSIAGDPDVTNFDTVIRGLAREHQRIVTGATASTAQMHVAAQETADQLLNYSMTEAQVRGQLKVMREEAENFARAANGEVDDLQRRYRESFPGAGRPAIGGGAASSAAAPSPEIAALLKKYGGSTPQ